MTIASHVFVQGPFGRCSQQLDGAPCNKRKNAHYITNVVEEVGGGTHEELAAGYSYTTGPEPTEIPGPAIRMILYSKQSMSKKSEEVEINWPADWRLPQQGEVITGYGFVNWIEFDPAARIIKVSMRG